MVTISTSIDSKNPRILRGGSFIVEPAYVRSAIRYWNAPASRYTLYGFRLSRTYP
jgi:formylglycine-generating enzyme required for sulfatase activity